MRKEDRYFIFNHENAFTAGFLSGVIWQDGGLKLNENESRGVFITPVLDSMARDNAWQRVLLNTVRPDDARITYRFFVVNQPYEAQAVEAMLHDPNGDADIKLRQLERFESFIAENTEDFLLQNVKGRYLFAAVELYKQGEVSPVVLQMMIYAAQESFLSYLPEIFQDEGGFLDRYLRLFSVQFLDLEKKISRLPASFDPGVAPSGLLRWLAEVMGIPHIELWETENLRMLLSERTYARKGTLSGLRELIKIYTGFLPHITENFRMYTGIGDIDRLYAGCRLLILMPPGSMNGSRLVDVLHLLIQSFIPLEISYKLILLEDKAQLSGYTYLDVNACLSDYNPAVLEADARVGYAVLGGINI